MTTTQTEGGVKILNFMRWRYAALILSALLLLASVTSLVVNNINFGLDFTGGTLIEVAYDKPAALDDVRDVLAQNNYQKAIVVHFGTDTDVLVRLPGDVDDKAGANLVALLNSNTGGSVELRRLEFVGPQVGEELREQGGLAMILALLVVMVYVAIRFQLKFSVGAVVALAHDVLIVLGVFSFFKLDFDLTVLAAILAVIGYSLNDTIVVSDRIRENFRRLREGSSIHIVNTSLSETLGRTIVTSLTTLLVLFALYYLGGEIIHNFALALIIGVGVGTYSSIYVAANVLLLMNISRDDLILIPKEEDPELAARP